MSGLRTFAIVISCLVGIAATAICGLVLFALLLTIGMSKSTPTFGEVLAEYWPAFGGAVLGIAAVVLSMMGRARSASVAALGAAVLLAWIIYEWLAPNLIWVGP